MGWGYVHTAMTTASRKLLGSRKRTASAGWPRGEASESAGHNPPEAEPQPVPRKRKTMTHKAETWIGRGLGGYVREKTGETISK